MSITSLNASIARLKNEIASLNKKISDEKKKEVDNIDKINKTQRSITKNTSQSLITSKLSQISRYQNEVNKFIKKQVDLQNTMAEKNKNLIRYEQQLEREQKIENKK